LTLGLALFFLFSKQETVVSNQNKKPLDMKKQLLSLIVLSFLSVSLNAQYCDITTATAYSMEMPGITNFQLNTINRTSLDIECGGVGCVSFVRFEDTGDSTDLVQGATYVISITHTRDSTNPLFDTAKNNIRIWIDYNQDGDYTDANETAYSADYEPFGTTVDSFTVPLSATLGSTRMRVTIKMSDEAGHTLPTPCDNPPDPLGYHGEFEEYIVTRKAATGIRENADNNRVRVFPNPSSGLFRLSSQSKISTISIIDILGAKVLTSTVNAYQADVDLSALPKGVYIYALTDGERVIGRGRLIVE